MKATRFAVLTLALLATACTGTLAEGRGVSVSSSLVEYLYPAGEKPPSPSRKIPSLPMPLRIGIAFVPSTRATQDLPEAERFKLPRPQPFSRNRNCRRNRRIPEQYLNQDGIRAARNHGRTYGLNAMALCPMTSFHPGGESALRSRQ